MALVKVTLPAARKNANLSQKDLAKICGVSESTVYNWENGKSEPTVTQAKEISKATRSINMIGNPIKKTRMAATESLHVELWRCF